MISNESSATLEKLRALSGRLRIEFWNAAAEAEDGDPAKLAKLVQLKAEMDAVEFAISNPPRVSPEQQIESLNSSRA